MCVCECIYTMLSYTYKYIYVHVCTCRRASDLDRRSIHRRVFVGRALVAMIQRRHRIRDLVQMRMWPILRKSPVTSRLSTRMKRSRTTRTSLRRRASTRMC